MTVVVVIVVVDVINLVDVVVVVDTIGLLLLWISAKEKLKLHFLNFDFTTFVSLFHRFEP